MPGSMRPAETAHCERGITMEQLIKVPPQPMSRREGTAAKTTQDLIKDVEAARKDIVNQYRYLYELAQLLGPGLERIQRDIEELREEEN